MAFWNKRSSFEKIVIGLFLGFLMFCLGYLSGVLPRFFCPICRQDLKPGEDYLWDVRTGDLLPISDYLSGQTDHTWIGGSSDIPQEVSAANRYGCARFPKDAESRVDYCSSHRSGFDDSQYFCVVSVRENDTVCYAIGGKGALTPDGQTILKRFNNDMQCWELIIKWDDPKP